MDHPYQTTVAGETYCADHMDAQCSDRPTLPPDYAPGDPCQCDCCRAEEDLPPLADPLEREWANAWAEQDVVAFLVRAERARAEGR